MMLLSLFSIFGTKAAEEYQQKGNTNRPAFKLGGVVVDDKNEPLIGVSVYIQGTTIGTTTDLAGKFSIQARSGNILEFKIIGYKPKTITITNEKNLQIVMDEDENVLEDVVVTSYGTQKKVSVVGAVQTIRPEVLKTPSTQLSTSFAGRIPGVIAVQRSGQPGADGASFWIRGISTFGGRATPLIIVDGIQLSEGDLNSIDPETIETFSILKDASATALYGSLGANGVLIVSTKSGKNMEKPRINVRLETSISSPWKKPKFIDGPTYMSMYNEAQQNPSSTSYVPYSQRKIEGTIAGKDPIMYPNVDWYNEIFKDSQTTRKALINVTGGSKKVDYFSSLSVSQETGMLRNRSKDFFSFNNNINIWRYNFQNNINMYLHPNTKFTVRLNVRLRDETSPYGNVAYNFINVINTSPVDFPVLYPHSDNRNQDLTTDYIMWGGKISTNTTAANPVAELARGYKTDFQSTVIAQVDLEQKLDFITKGLKFNGFIAFKNWSQTRIGRTAGYNLFYVDKPQEDDLGNITSYSLINAKGSVQSTVLDINGGNSYGTGDRRMSIQGRLNYQKEINKDHDLTAMAVYNQEETNINTPGSLKGSLPFRKIGLSGRLTYGYKHKYLFETNFGYNGSENFAKGHRFGFFPSLAAGYNISQEKFWKPLSKAITNMKIRGSWGLVGNDQTNSERFLYLADLTLQSGNASYTTGVDQNHTLYGPTYNRYQNDKLGWEIGEKVNIGLDLDLFHDLSLVFELYREKRRDIFMQRQAIPNFFGTASTVIYGNLGKVENKGFEVAANYNRRLHKTLLLSFNGSFTYAANKIKEYDEPAYKLYPGLSRVGHAVHQPLLYQAERLFIDQGDIKNSPTQKIGSFVSPGDIKYTDLKNRHGETDNQIDASDRQYTGMPSVPEIVYGFGSSIKFKKWDFSFFLQGAARTSLIMSGFHPFGTSIQHNVLQFIADDYWSMTNQNIHARYPRLSIVDNSNNTAASTYWQRDASFLKLKTLEAGYTFKFLRVYVTGSNILTFSKFKYWDPEMGGGAGLQYPTMRTFNTGIQLIL